MSNSHETKIDRSTKVKHVSSDEFQASLKNEYIFDERLLGKDRDRIDYPAIVGIRYTARRMLPYGRWTTGNGRIITFNREYQPMFERVDGVDHFMLSSEFISDIVLVEYFYGDHNAPMYYLLRKFNNFKLSDTAARPHRKSLLICFAILKEFEPKSNVTGSQATWHALRDHYR